MPPVAVETARAGCVGTVMADLVSTVFGVCASRFDNLSIAPCCVISLAVPESAGATGILNVTVVTGSVGITGGVPVPPMPMVPGGEGFTGFEPPGGGPR
jgi:hypothetical protein